MVKFALWMGEELAEGECAGCRRPSRWKKGPQVGQGLYHDPICRECAKVEAPELLALLDLALLADKVGRNNRHLLTPPMEAMLELTRAAETFACAVPRQRPAA